MNTETLLLLNSILTTTAGALFLVMGYFFRDLHKDFKKLIDRVNQLSRQLSTHIAKTESTAEEIERLRKRLAALESKISSKW